MGIVRNSASPKPASFFGLHSSFVADDESSLEEIVEAPIADDVAGKKVAASPFDPQTYRRDKVWVTIFQVDDVQRPLRAVS